MRRGRAGRAWRRAGATALMALGCVASPAPSDHFYQLEAQAPARPRAAPVFPGTLAVDLLQADALAGERPLVYRNGEDSPELLRHSYHYWVETPTRMTQLELARYLRAAGAASQVVTPEMRIHADYLVGGRILRLERILGEDPPRVRVELELVVVRMPQRDLMLLGTFLEEEPAEDGSVEASVRAMNRALTRIYAAFLARSAS